MSYLRMAGWPVYPVLAFGLTALLLALRHALAPQRNLVALVVGLAAASVLTGLLGTALGLDATIGGVRELPPEQRWIFFLGLQESLYNLDFALLLAVPTTLLAAVGGYRLRSRLDAIAARA